MGARDVFRCDASRVWTSAGAIAMAARILTAAALAAWVFVGVVAQDTKFNFTEAGADLSTGFCEGCDGAGGEHDACIALSKAPSDALLRATCPREEGCVYAALHIGAPISLEVQDVWSPGRDLQTDANASAPSDAESDPALGNRRSVSSGEKQCMSWLFWRTRLIALYGGIPVAPDSNVFVIPVFGIVNIGPPEFTRNRHTAGGPEHTRSLFSLRAHQASKRLINGAPGQEADTPFRATLLYSAQDSQAVAAAALAALEEASTPVITGAVNGPHVYICPGPQADYWERPFGAEEWNTSAAPPVPLAASYPPCKEGAAGLRRFSNLFSTTSWDDISFLPFLGIATTQFQGLEADTPATEEGLEEAGAGAEDGHGPLGGAGPDVCRSQGMKVAVLYEEEPFLEALANEVMESQDHYGWSVHYVSNVSRIEPGSVDRALAEAAETTPDVVIGSVSINLCRQFIDGLATHFLRPTHGPGLKAACLSHCFDASGASYFYGGDSRWMSGISYWNPHLSGENYQEQLISRYAADLYSLPLFYATSNEDVARVQTQARGPDADGRLGAPVDTAADALGLTAFKPGPGGGLGAGMNATRASLLSRLELDLITNSERKKSGCKVTVDADDLSASSSYIFATSFLQFWSQVPDSMDASSTVMGYIVSQVIEHIFAGQSQDLDARDLRIVTSLIDSKPLWQENLRKTYFQSFFGLVSVDALGQNSANRVVVVQEDDQGEVQILEPPISRTKEFVFPMPPYTSNLRNFPCPAGTVVQGANRWCTFDEMFPAHPASDPLSSQSGGGGGKGGTAAVGGNDESCNVFLDALEGGGEDLFPRWYATSCAACPKDSIAPTNGSLLCEPCKHGANEDQTACLERTPLMRPWQIALVAVVASLVMFGLCFGLLLFRKSGTYLKMKEERKKKKLPLAAGEATYCVTDIEGSTTLWEWNADAMDRALKIHHKVCRSLTTRYFGFEIATEGDAFFLVFHSKRDAAHFCLALQQRLLEEEHWPPELNELPCSQTVHAKDDPEGPVLFRGLRVRMGVHTCRDETQTSGFHQRSFGFRCAKALCGESPLPAPFLPPPYL